MEQDFQQLFNLCVILQTRRQNGLTFVPSFSVFYLSPADSNSQYHMQIDFLAMVNHYLILLGNFDLNYEVGYMNVVVSMTLTHCQVSLKIFKHKIRGPYKCICIYSYMCM